MAPGSTLPTLHQRVYIWFDGYDEFYPGRVANLTPPFEFKVVLEDGTDWNIDSRKHVYKFSNDDAQAQPEPEEEGEPAKTDMNKKPASKKNDDESEKQVSADDRPEPNGAQTRRRAGRALRKNAAPLRTVEPDVAPQEDQEGEPHEEAENDENDYVPKEDDENEPEELPRLRIRRSARVADEERERRDEPERRTTRSRARTIGEPARLPPRTRKKAAAKRTMKPGAEEERPVKRRKQVEEPMDQLDDEPIRDEDGAAGLSTKAVTAIAVQAALESAKAVLKPLSDKMTSIVKSFSEINVLMKQSTEAAARDAVKKVISEPEASKGTLAALANFQLDFAEVVGGGEARMKAHSKLSEQEFDHLNRMIEYQGKALKELERLLYAAKEFGKKPVVEEPEPTPDAEVNGKRNGKEKEERNEKESENEKNEEQRKKKELNSSNPSPEDERPEE